jgi:tRNA threonylcarbamoyladenosine biosynthesis protein TsaE
VAGAGALVDEAGLVAWGREFARSLTPPAAIALSGELGAGKTTLVRAIADALGAAGPVTSPTYTLVHRYDGNGVTLHHVDAYRLRPQDDVRDLGLEEMLADPRGILLVEWPERLGAGAPAFTHRVTLAHGDDPLQRRLTCTSR